MIPTTHSTTGRTHGAPLSRRSLVRAVAAAATAAAVLLLPLSSHAATGYDWPQFDGNAQHSGNNTAETIIAGRNVGTLHRLFQVSLPDVADGAPAYLSAVTTTSGIRDLLYLTTKDGHILALDAHSGATIWSHQYGPGSCQINGSGGPCYTTSSPAIDPSRQYVYSYGLDGAVHKYQAGNGTEVRTGGWPERATLKPFNEKGSSALSIATARSGTSYLYVTNGGYPGDQGDYQGHITAINLATGAQRVFNTLCSNVTVNGAPPHFVQTPGTPDCPHVQSAVWARPGVVYDAATDKIYAATGNGDYTPGSFDWGDSVLALHPDGSGNAGGPLDSYTPADYQTLQNTDQDLGSTAPAILPVPWWSLVPHVAVQGGKDAMLRLLDLDNLSLQGGPGHVGGELGAPIPVPQGGEVLTQPAVWINPLSHVTWVFVATSNGISALRVIVPFRGVPRLQVAWQTSTGGTSPLVANNLVYDATANGIAALNPLTGQQMWVDSSVSNFHWESPIVANGVLYITDEDGHLTAYTVG